MDYQSFQPGAKDQPASPSSVPEISKSQSVSERLRPYQWHIAIVGGIIIVLLFGAYRYLRYTAQQNDAAVAREAQDAQNKIDEIYQKRANLETYHNEQYGFSIALPDSWKGYVVLNSQWEGRDVATGNVTERGPVITLRHPQWTLSAPREDMPVMVFNPAQWQLVQHEEMAVSAAPIPPSILGQNSKYIIALPARYNYDYKTGWEEVDQLVHTLKAFEPGQVSVNGTLSGHVTIGPNCPVERVGVPCTPAPEAYTSRQVSVYKSDGTTIVKTQNFDTQGNYSVALSAGNYVVKSRTGISFTPNLVGTVTIKAGQITTLNFSIDTGIR